MMQRGVFDASELVKVFSRPNLHSVMPGNKVMLRSGGPRMIVRETTEDGKSAVCDWDDDGGVRQTHTFALVCLTCYGAEL